MIFHLDYSEKACQYHATLINFNTSLEAGSLGGGGGGGGEGEVSESMDRQGVPFWPYLKIVII